MERRQFKTARIDLLSQLNESNFWENIDKINRELAAYSSEDPKDIPEERHPKTLALELLSRYYKPQYLDETATATIAHKSPNGELSTEQITGQLGLFTYADVTSTEECGGVEIMTDQRVAALQIGETAVPLSPETLLQLDIEKPTPDEASTDTFSYIMNQVLEIASLPEKQSYQAASLSEKAMLTVNAVDNANQHLDAITNDGTVSIVTLHPELKYNDGTARSSIRAQDISVEMRGGHPHFQIIDTDGLIHAIPYGGVIDIKITDEPVDASTNVVDFFNNNEEIRSRIDYIEGATRCSEDDLAGLIKDLEETIGDGFCQNGIFSGTGMLYRQTSSGDIEDELTDFTLFFQGFDVLEIDGERKLVIALKNPHNPADKLYVIPDTTHLSQGVRKNVPRAMEFEPDCSSLSEDLRSAARAAARLVESDEFLEAADIEQQQGMLDEDEAIDVATSNLIYIFDNFYQGYQIRCTAKKYWAIPIDMYESYSPEDIASLPPTMAEQDKEMLDINGDVVEFFVPEMVDRKEKITSPADFPLSGGQPMLRITDVSSGEPIYYLVPIGDLLDIAPITQDGEAAN